MPYGRVHVENGYEWAALFETLYKHAAWVSEAHVERRDYYDRDDGPYFDGSRWCCVHRETLQRYANVRIERRRVEQLAGPPSALERALAKRAHLSTLRTLAAREALLALEPSVTPVHTLERVERSLVIDAGGTVVFARELHAQRNARGELTYDGAYCYSVTVDPPAFVGVVVYELQRVRESLATTVAAAEVRAYMRWPCQPT